MTEIAEDPRGAAIVEHLAESGVEVLRESFMLRRTSTAVVHVATDGQAGYEFDVTWSALPPLGAIEPRVLHTGSIAAFLEPGATSVRRLMRDSMAEHITFDPNIRPALVPARPSAVKAFEDTAALSTVVKMSDQDAEWLYPGVALDSVIARVFELGPQLCAITLGSDGALMASRTERVRVPAVKVAAVDTIGAGDTFMASLIHSLLNEGSGLTGKCTLERIAADAVHAAAITVSRAGANLPWVREL